MKRIVLLSLALATFACTGAVQAQIDDRDFAMGLADRSYFDLAKELLNDMVGDASLSPIDKTSAQLGLVGVLKRSADKESNGIIKLEKYREAAKGYEAFIADPTNEDHPDFFDALFEFGELLQSKGEAIGKIIEEEENQDRIAELRTEGTEAIQEAQGLLQKAADFLESIPEEERDDTLYQKALFFKSLNYYFVAALQEPGSFEKENNLKLAADELEDFAWSYEGTRAGWLALLYVGKSNGERALENEERSEEFADTAINYLEGIVAPLDIQKELIEDRWYVSLVQRALYEQTRVYNWMKRFPDAINNVKRLDSLLTAEDGSKVALGTWGYLAQLERINALEEMQDLEGAINLCQAMAKQAEGSVGRRLARRLSELVDAGKSNSSIEITIPPDVLFTTAQGFYGQKNWFRAIEYFQKVIDAIHKTGTDQEREPEVWNYIGRSYKRLNENLAAAIAFETGAKLKGVDNKLEIVETNAFSAYGAYTQQIKLESRGKEVAEFVREKHLDMREYLTRTYPGTDLVYYAGIDELETGNFDGAIKELEKVEKKSEVLYPRAQAKLAECHFEIGKDLIEKTDGPVPREARDAFVKIDSIKSNFDRFVNDPNWQTGNSQAQDERKQARAAISYYLARAKAAVGKTDEAIAILKSYPEDFAGQDNFIEAAIFLAAEIEVETGDLVAAEQTVKQLDEGFPKSKVTSAAYLKIGQAFKRLFNEALETYAKGKNVDDANSLADEFINADEGARSNLTKSSDFVKIWWDKQGRPFSKGLEIGNDYFRIKEYDKALEVLEAIYKRDADNMKIKAQQRRALKFRLAETYLWHKRFEDAVPLYAELFEQYIGDKKGVVNPSLRENYAMALGGTAILEPGREVVEYDGIEDFAKAKEIWTPIANTRGDLRFTPIYWKAKFHVAYMDYKMGETANAKALVDNLMALYGQDLKNDPSGPLFNWLQRKL